MYADLELIGVATAVLADAWLRRPRRWHAPAVGALVFVGLLTHVSMFLLGAGLLALAGRRLDRESWRWRFAVVCGVLGWVVVWGPSFVAQSRGGHSNWIPRTTIDGMVQTFGRLVTYQPGLHLVMLAATATGAVLLWKSDRRLGRVWVCCVLVPAGIAAVAGTVAPVMLDRTVTVVSWGPLLAIGYLVAGAARRHLVLGAAAIRGADGRHGSRSDRRASCAVRPRSGAPARRRRRASRRRRRAPSRRPAARAHVDARGAGGAAVPDRPRGGIRQHQRTRARHARAVGSDLAARLDSSPVAGSERAALRARLVGVRRSPVLPRNRETWALISTSVREPRKDWSMKFTRGFTGRGEAERDPRLPPGQYDTGQAVAGAHRRGHAEARHRRRGRSRSTASSSTPTTWTWDEIHALPPSTYEGDIHCVTTWSKLGDARSPGVSVDTLLDVARPAADGDARARVLAHRLHDEPAARRRHRRQGVGRVGGRRRAARRASTAARRACSCRTSTSGRAPSGSPGCACSTTTSPASGSATATTTAATPGSSSATRATDVAAAVARRRRVVVDPRRDAARQDVPPRARRADRVTAPASTTSCGSPRPTATPRRARTRSRRRPTTRNEIELTVERLDDGEVSTFLHDVVELGDELEVRGPIGGWFVWDGDTPGAARRRRLGRRAADGDAAPRPPRRADRDLVRLVVSVRTPDDLYYADELPGPETTVVYTRERRPAAARPPGRLDGRRPRAGVAARRDRVRVRLVRLRRRRERSARRPRRARRADPRRALRPERLTPAAPRCYCSAMIASNSACGSTRGSSLTLTSTRCSVALNRNGAS